MWRYPLIAFVVAPLLAGCGGGSLDKYHPTATTPICDALIGPIKTNTKKPTSKRYLPATSTTLRSDIKQRNQVGENLNCPAYH